jgi:hypothetical protein
MSILRRILGRRPAPPAEPLQLSGYTIVLDGYDETLASVARLVRIPVAGRSDEELQAAIAAPKASALELVATPEELARCCRDLGFTIFQGEFFGRPDPTRRRRVGTGGDASLAALAAVARRVSRSSRRPSPTMSGSHSSCCATSTRRSSRARPCARRSPCSARRPSAAGRP